MLADQLICRLECIHSHDIIHQDIKPGNCLMGRGRQANVTDLDLATERVDSRPDVNTGRPLRPKLIGTAYFASVNGHLGVGKCNILKRYPAKTNHHTSTKSL